jgi:hypothetical protein
VARTRTIESVEVRPPTTLTLTESQREILHNHLFPQDGCEAVAIALCGRATSATRHRLLVRKLALIPYDACSVRKPDQVTWPTELLVPFLEEAARNNWAIVKIHGHRGFRSFSSVDDESDRALFPSVYAWMDTSDPHGSAILMDDGTAFGRVVTACGTFHNFHSIAIVGANIVQCFDDEENSVSVPAHGRRIAQTFGAGTYDRLRRLRIAVVGCSGTGSPVIEQLARNCVGSLVLVDPDHVEEKNLNRILNATMDDARHKRSKVHVAERSVRAMGLKTSVEAYASTLFNPEVIRAVGSCDAVFGCMDSLDGRHLLNKLATFYLLPYFDLGVKIEADGQGGVDQVCGTVHYLKPGGSSLLSRHVFTLEQVRVAGLQRTDPDEYRSQLEEGYIRGVLEDRPAVIQLNSLIASLAVNELLARIHPYRSDPNDDYAVMRVSLSHGIFDHEPDGEPCSVLRRHLGRGDVVPLVDWAELSEERAGA